MLRICRAAMRCSLASIGVVIAVALTALTVLENYLQLGAGLAQVGTDAMPVGEDRLLSSLALIVPSDATLVEILALSFSLSFALGVFWTAKIGSELIELMLLLFVWEGRHDGRERQQIVGRLAQRVLIATAVGTLLAIVAMYEYELFTLRGLANADGIDHWKPELLGVAPWHAAEAEYSQSYILLLARQFPAAYLAITATAAILLEVSVASARDRFQQLLESIDEYMDDSLDPLPEAEPGEASDIEDGGVVQPEAFAEESVEAQSAEAAPGRQPTTPRAQERARAGAQPILKIVRDAPTADGHQASEVPPQPPAGGHSVEVLGRPGTWVTLAEAQHDASLYVDVTTGVVWDRAYYESLREPPQASRQA